MTSDATSSITSLDDVMQQLDILDEFEVRAGANQTDPYPVFERFRNEQPVYSGDIFIDELDRPFSIASGFTDDRPVFSLLRYADVADALRDGETFSSTIYEETIGQTQGRNIIMMDAPEHKRYRMLLQKVFTRRVMEEWRDGVVRPLILDRFLPGILEGGSADLMRDLCLTYPVSVIHRILGMPSDLTTEIHTVAVGLLLYESHPEVATACSAWLAETLTDVVEQRRRAPGDDVVSHLIAAEIDGHRLSDEEIISFLRLLLPAGGETTTRGTSNLIVALLRDDEQMQLLRDDRSLIPSAVDEALRWEAPVTSVYRITRQPVEVGDIEIPTGSGIDVVIASANRDPEQFEDPDRFDLRRHAASHMSFAYGPHLCLGMNMAKMEIEVAIETMLDEMPNVRFDPDVEPPELTGVTFRSPVSIPVVFDSAAS